jgi:uncharacterized membrane protein YbhN (UPF0104 family)
MPSSSLPSWLPSRAWVRLLQAGLAAVAVYLTWRLLGSIGWAALGHRIAAARRLPLAAALAALYLRFVFWDARFRSAARRALGAATGPVLGWFVLLASSALHLLTPSARLIGGLVRARYLARAAGRGVPGVFGVVLFDQLAHHAVMIAATWAALAVSALALRRTALGLAALASGVVLAALGWFMLRRQDGGSLPERLAGRMARASAAELAAAELAAAELAAAAGRGEGAGSAGADLRSKTARSGSWHRPLVAGGREAVAVCARLLGDRSLLAPVVVFGMGYFLANAAAQWLVFAALGEPVDPLTVVTVVALGNAAGLFAGTPGGAGTTEAAMVPLYVMLGVGAPAAAAGTLVYRGLHYAGVLAAGLPALAVLELRGPRRRLDEDRDGRGEES